MNVKRILIVKMSAVGDVIMTLPALNALHRAYPAAKIDWLVEAPSAKLLEGHPLINRVLISPRHHAARLVKARRYSRTGRLLAGFRKRLRAVNYDVVIDLQGLIKSGFFTWLARGKRKVGFDRSREKTGFFLNEKMPAYDPDRHAALRYLDAAVYLGAAYPEPSLLTYYAPPPEAAAEAQTLIGGREFFVILNPGAKWETKRWPLAHWQTLAAALSAENIPLMLTGGREDAAWCAAIEQAAPAALNLCGRTTLPALAALMERAALVITADTGPMHLAAAVGARGLALFGPTLPHRTGPFGGRFKILTPNLDCLGCLKRVCDDPAKPCLAALTPQTVLTEALAQLGH